MHMSRDERVRNVYPSNDINKHNYTRTIIPTLLLTLLTNLFVFTFFSKKDKNRNN